MRRAIEGCDEVRLERVRLRGGKGVKVRDDEEGAEEKARVRLRGEGRDIRVLAPLRDGVRC